MWYYFDNTQWFYLILICFQNGDWKKWFSINLMVYSATTYFRFWQDINFSFNKKYSILMIKILSYYCDGSICYSKKNAVLLKYCDLLAEK